MEFAFTKPVPFEMAAFCTALEDRHLPTWKKEFWLRVEDEAIGLSGAIGVYIFAIQHGESIKPWYVGKTYAKNGFKAEVFQNHKASHYKSLEARKGSAQLLFVPLLTKSGKFSKNTTGASKGIDWVEKRLISFALTRNPELLNVRDTKIQGEVFVPGLMGTRRVGKPRPDAKLARKIFFGEK